MTSEPYKIKEIKTLPRMEVHDRWNLLKKVDFNTFRLYSDFVTFDLVSKGMSSWSHFQKAGYMIGDEAYAGSRNYERLTQTLQKVLGIDRLVPTHNGIGAEKLLSTTLLKKGQFALHNRGRSEGLVEANGGQSVDVTDKKAARFPAPEKFGGDVDLKQVTDLLEKKGAKGIAYVHIEACPDGWNGQPLCLSNLKKLSELTSARGVPLALDISNALENAYWILQEEKGSPNDLLAIVRKMVACADIVLMDASQDCRADVGGFITSTQDELFELFRNQVVVFEGLHTYGGMTGRAMEVLAVGLEEMQNPAYTHWYMSQVGLLNQMLEEKGVPVHRGARGVALELARFLPHLNKDDWPKFALASCLYMYGGIRPRIDGDWAYHAEGHGSQMLSLELPRHAYTRDHLREMANTIAVLYQEREKIRGLRLCNRPEFVDQAHFAPKQHRLFVSLDPDTSFEPGHYEPYKVAVFEPIQILEKSERKKAIEAAGYNTFLLDSKDVYVDFLTDSGTTAMSCNQWEGMTNSTDTPYSSRHYRQFVRDFSEILGYDHVLPTHQGRAAEHIMSQVMIEPGQIVPGNMYFTTTKLHQEMAGGIFVDVIVDEAHDPKSTFEWKGNIDLEKLKAQINKVGAKKVAYVSFEMSVNMAGGQPFSMDNVRAVSKLCQENSIPLMFDATRCVENAYMVKLKDPAYAHKTVKEILREMMSYGDGCTISCKKDFLVNMGGVLACNDDGLAEKFQRMLRVWEGDVTNGGLDPKDIEALRRGLLESLDDRYIQMRIEQTQEFGRKLNEAGVAIVNPPGSHAIFLDARSFLPHLDQEEYPAQALAAAIYIETGVRCMERGNVSKGRNPETGENYKPALELVRCTIPRRVYSNSHIDFVVEGIKRLYKKRDRISGLEFTYEPKLLRFFQGRFAPKAKWDF